MRILLRSIPFVLAFIIILPGLLPASGGSRQPPSNTTIPDMPNRTQTPEEQAILQYNDGLKMRDKAWRYEEKAKQASSDKKRAKYEKKARKQYNRAIDAFTTAATLNPRFHQAFGSLGYSLRKVGRLTDALAAYDNALVIEPVYSEAIEYRGEAYLGLDRIDEAKEAYMRLFALDQPQADMLMAAMQHWIESRRQDPAGMTSDEVESFSKWIRNRLEIAGQTDSLSQLRERDW
jgi:tetratricopeptide (TPR) repeat protein